MTTETIATSFTPLFLQSVNGFLRDKGTALEARVMSAAFGITDILEELGIHTGVPDEETFTHRFWTTIGPLIYKAEDSDPEKNPEGWIEVLTHEGGHVLDFWKDPVKFVTGYVGEPEARAAFEAHAEWGRLEVRWFMSGTLPATRDELSQSLARSYRMDAETAELAAGLLESRLTTISAGLIASPHGKKAVKILHQLGMPSVGAIKYDPATL